MVTLAILALDLAVAVPAFDRLAPGFALRSAARDAAAMLREARGLAISRAGEVAVVVDLDARSIGIEGTDRLERFDDDVAIGLYSAAEELVDERAGRIRFYPDGTSTGGRIGLSAPSGRYDIKVSWITGAVTTHE